MLRANTPSLPAVIPVPDPSGRAITDAALPPLASEFLSLQYVKPFVRNDSTGKSLHFTLGELQSRMLSSSPWQLDLDYTRTMMGFLLFNRAPAHIGMIGLGGGSLVKFCHRSLPLSKMTVLEINPHVIALRREFLVPDDAIREVLESRAPVSVLRELARKTGYRPMRDEGIVRIVQSSTTVEEVIRVTS